MPSVAEELAALKQRSLTKNLAEKLKDADGLSTPEQEEAKVQNTSKTNRASIYKKDAVETLKAGTKAVDKDLEFKQKQIAQKKQDMQKKEEAAKNLKSFNTAKVAATTQGKGKQQKNGSNSKQAPAPSPAPAQTSTPAVPEPATSLDAPEEEIVFVSEDEYDVPELEEVDDVPELEDAMVPELSSSSDWGGVPTPEPPKRVPNRAEKKAKKTIEKLGMKSVPGIARVTLKLKGSQGFYTIFQPDVFVKNGTYVIFGEAQQGAGIMDQQAQAARAAKMLDTPVPPPSAAATEASTTEDAAGEPEVDETGLEAKDIELVISQAGCSRSKAVTALRENNGDLVNAIMSLTT